MSPDAATLSTHRTIAATAEAIYGAFAAPDQLATWWGPAGFTNTFHQFDFQPGGRWVFDMHGPNGATYANESVFKELVPGERVVIEHVVAPWFELTVTLAARGEQPEVEWHQRFESAAMASRVQAIVGPANEENLDRLTALLGAG